MGLFFPSEEDKRYLRFRDVEKVTGPVNHVGNHEVRKCRFDDWPRKKYMWLCWRCGNKEDEPNEFRDITCHHCTCKYCHRRVGEMTDNETSDRERLVTRLRQTQAALNELHRNYEGLEGAVEDAVATMRGEANEISARDDVDDHLGDVIQGLQYGAWELENRLENPPGDKDFGADDSETAEHYTTDNDQ